MYQSREFFPLPFLFHLFEGDGPHEVGDINSQPGKPVIIRDSTRKERIVQIIIKHLLFYSDEHFQLELVPIHFWYDYNY